MNCRCCGHDNNGRDTGKCENCGFGLSKQNDPLFDQRTSLQKKLDKPVDFKERSEFTVPPPRGHIPTVGALIAIVGLATAIIITQIFTRSEFTPQLAQRTQFEVIVEENPIDSVAALIGSDIVYVLNDSASRALPRTNVDMTLIPEGSTVSFLGSRIVPLRPAANYVLQKISLREIKSLEIDRLCVWTDSTETHFYSSPLIRLDQTIVDSIPGAVIVKYYFTPEMIRGSVDEFSIRYDKAITTDDFTDSQLSDVIFTVARRLQGKDYGERQVQVAAMFDYDAYNLGDAVFIMNRIAPFVIDSLGFSGFSVSVFSLTD
ncbi:MAG: hypothetical protein KAQ97_04895 [Candidatus Fermentibacteraceae bacterium]|nr:hypothetical protein [Candidatus Fermentibacteraceae bacterium]